MPKFENPKINSFFEYLTSEFAIGSGAPRSYVSAIDIVNRVMQNSGFEFANGVDSIWNQTEINQLAYLYTFVKEEQRKVDGGIFKNEECSSYWKHNYCSAAIKAFSSFLSLSKRESEMHNFINEISDAVQLSKKLDTVVIENNPMLIKNDEVSVNSAEGKQAIKEVRQIQNQQFFRKMLLTNYRNRCSLTGLSVVDVLKVSHILPDLKNKSLSMNPENGVCLSATYAVAFEKKLISFDDKYRLILSSSLKDYSTNDGYRKFFKSFEGKQIEMPVKFAPSQVFLQKHREKMI